MDHSYALRAPWYVRARENLTPFDDAARRPAIQKYDGTDFVDRLLADPRDSVAFEDEDRWGFPVRVPTGAKGSGRLRFADHAIVLSPLRKLYQPLHHRFYAVVVELFCDERGCRGRARSRGWTCPSWSGASGRWCTTRWRCASWRTA